MGGIAKANDTENLKLLICYFPFFRLAGGGVVRISISFARKKESAMDDKRAMLRHSLAACDETNIDGILANIAVRAVPQLRTANR